MEMRIEHLYKKYGGQEVLRDVSFRIPAGMYGLLGSNGAGKKRRSCAFLPPFQNLQQER